MTADLIKAAVVLLVTLIGGGIGWDQVKKHGAETERRKQAERERDAATVQIHRHAEPVPDDASYGSRLRRAQDRLARLRGRAPKR